ncbi:DUF4810 domain-containing protein [Actinobacillus vicugnae]|uniref:DUF4810 domain-containing protein n=1 Tax=Actinobacillus vicugnae TaxID=2573093 RepID=UPI001FCAF81B|nr:DUF4810 domain-containing protein [Actinobacillus vicugnae]
MNKIYAGVFVAITMMLAGCLSKSVDTDIYYWGNYSDVVYSYYNEPNDFAKQADSLNNIIQTAKEKNKPVAPGVYGHLGLALLKQGKTLEAQNAFQQEQQLFPESKVFMQHLQRKR